jgi:hypothetical protein
MKYKWIGAGGSLLVAALLIGNLYFHMMNALDRSLNPEIYHIDHVERVEIMPTENHMFLSFLLERIDSKIGDMRDAGSQEEIEVYLNDLEAYMQGIKKVYEVEGVQA